MKKFLSPLIVVLIVLALAGMVYWRSSTSSVIQTDENQSQETIPWADQNPSPSVSYTIQPKGGDSQLWLYHVPNGKLEGPINSWEGGPGGRFQSGSDICAGLGTRTISLVVECDLDENNILTLNVFDRENNDKRVIITTIDPSKLGIKPSASEGYLLPVAVAADKSAIYLGRRVETESYVAGLWKLDVSTGEVSEIMYVRENNMYQYDINPTTKQLIGVTFVPPESLGENIGSPSGVHLVDLSTGEGRPLELASRDVYENPMLSDDGNYYAFYESGMDVEEGPHSIVLTMKYGRVASGWIVDGVIKDWFGNTLVFDRDGNLFLYDLKTSTETQITFETEATVEYLGVVK